MSLDLIRSTGDGLEQQMFNDAAFSGWFTNYPLVWAKCVYPYRTNGGALQRHHSMLECVVGPQTSSRYPFQEPNRGRRSSRLSRTTS
jgi:hypothetical protein